MSHPLALHWLALMLTTMPAEQPEDCLHLLLRHRCCTAPPVAAAIPRPQKWLLSVRQKGFSLEVQHPHNYLLLLGFPIVFRQQDMSCMHGKVCSFPTVQKPE